MSGQAVILTAEEREAVRSAISLSAHFLKQSILDSRVSYNDPLRDGWKLRLEIFRSAYRKLFDQQEIPEPAIAPDLSTGTGVKPR